jgi:hypothetical protein
MNLNFDNMAALAAHIRTTPVNRIAEFCDSSARPASKWHDNMSFDDALDICETKGGYWKKGADSVHKIALTTATPTATLLPTKRPTRVLAGSRPHVAAYIAGAPKCMLKPVKRDRVKPVVKIGIALGVSNGVEARHMFNRGAAILSAVKALESKGYKVQIDGLLGVKYNKARLLTTVKIKSAQQPFSAADLGFILTHVCVTRRYFMALIERCTDDDIAVACLSNYGKPWIPDKLPHDIVIPMNADYCTSKERADTVIQELFKAV